jgi:hypothetical protein
MIRLTHLIVLAAIVFTALQGCDIADRKSKKFYRAQGKWNIENFETITYDTAGAVIEKTAVSNLGYLQFLQSGSLSAFYDYRLGIYMKLETFSGTDSTSYKGYSMEYYFDGERFDIRGINAYLEIDGTYTATENRPRHMVLQVLTPFAGNPKNSIYKRRTMVLKKM